jgi:hypothetical protein
MAIESGIIGNRYRLQAKARIVLDANDTWLGMDQFF